MSRGYATLLIPATRGPARLIRGEELDLPLPEPRAREDQLSTFPFWISDDSDLVDLSVMLDQEGNVPESAPRSTHAKFPSITRAWMRVAGLHFRASAARAAMPGREEMEFVS